MPYTKPIENFDYNIEERHYTIGEKHCIIILDQ